ncbi:Conserved hypothetical protein [Prochlorococcus marinus str. MIT 9303]|uniref:Uncharacterized protein n=1 Tax=Prochlorococcus marinus (strain MIT 9303) TaxID=59922 RepID=A2CBK0_PROM3|nr:Conserved hypothetical protein [Prochlorococcus marinus str. MIT 9303]
MLRRSGCPRSFWKKLKSSWNRFLQDAQKEANGTFTGL